MTHLANRTVRDVLLATGIGPQAADEGEHILRVGRMVGNLERLMILALLLRGDSSLAVGLVLTARSVARFDELRDRNRAGYYAVGTLTSILIAIIVAAAVAAA